MIKIAFIIDTIESPTAGTEKQLLMLIKHLDRSRFAPTLFVLRSSQWLDKEFNLCPLETINFQSYFNLKSLRQFFKFVWFLRENKFDCLQTYFIDSNIIGVFAAKFAGVSLIVSSRRDQGYWHTAAKLFLFKLTNRWVHFFVANCHSTAKWGSRTEAIQPDRMKIIYNGLEFEQFQILPKNKKDKTRREIGLRAESFVVCIVANLRPVKQIHIFLQSAALVKASLKNVQFLVIGEGEERRQLEVLASELGIADTTIFIGRRNDVPKLLQVCNLAVLTSSSESLSNAIIEYLASGLPVVTTDVGGCREIIEDGVNGYIVPPSDFKSMAERIIDLANTDNLATISSRNREKAKAMFSHEAMVSSYDRLYTEGICR